MLNPLKVTPMWIVFVLVFISYSIAPLESHEKNFEESLEGEHFTILYHSGYDKIAGGVLQTAEEAYPRVSQVLNYTPSSKINIYISSSEDEFYKLTGITAPKDKVVMGTWTKNAIFLSDSGDRTVVVHELSHGMLNQAVGIEQIPLWFDEGLATYLSLKSVGGNTCKRNRANATVPLPWESNIGLAQGEPQLYSLFEYDKVLLPLIAEEPKSFISIEDLERTSSQTSLLYAESTSIFHFIEERYGAKKITQVVNLARKYKDVKLAIEEALGRSFEDFESDWKYYLFRSSIGVDMAMKSVEKAQEEGRRSNFENIMDKLFWSVSFYNEGKFDRASNLARQTNVMADSAESLSWEEDFWNFISY